MKDVATEFRDRRPDFRPGEFGVLFVFHTSIYAITNPLTQVLFLPIVNK